MPKAKSAPSSANLNRRSAKERRGTDRRTSSVAVETERRQTDRRKVPRRRQIDPTTCERDYSVEELEFMSALDEYKRRNGRMFPTCSEVLEVVRGLGYEKRSSASAEVAVPSIEPATANVVTEPVSL